MVRRMFPFCNSSTYTWSKRSCVKLVRLNLGRSDENLIGSDSPAPLFLTPEFISFYSYHLVHLVMVLELGNPGKHGHFPSLTYPYLTRTRDRHPWTSVGHGWEVS